jgi:hypothetical protein
VAKMAKMAKTDPEGGKNANSIRYLSGFVIVLVSIAASKR